MAERPLVDESNPQGIASDEEKDAAYKAGLKNELVNAQASLKAAERYGDDAKAKVEKGHILDIEEELAKVGGASEDEAAAPKKDAAKKDEAVAA
jgi:hypothetical protein